MITKTISMCQGKGSLSHNNREFTAKNIDPSRTADNIVFIQQDLGDAYHQLFDEAVARYNAHQKRKDRMIDDYFQHLFNREPSKSVITGANKQKSFYEDLVQIGTKDDMMNNDSDIYKQLTVINRDSITSIGDLEGRISKLTADYKALQAQLSRKLLEQEDDGEMSSEILALKDSLVEKKKKIAMYTDIRETYYDISRGDYISKLVEEEKQHREQEYQKEFRKTKKKKGSR